MALEIKESTAKKLFALSRNHCARSNCNAILVINDKINLGEMCHIRGEKPTSARYDPLMGDEERRDISNLIILCNNCHTIIDTDIDTYIVEKLQQMKQEHESKEGDLFDIPENLLKKLMDEERIRIQSINQSGDGQQLITHSGDINVQGWQPHDVLSLLQSLTGRSLPNLEPAQSKMKDNVESFASFFKSDLEKITEKQKEQFKDPDLILTLENAVKIASRKSSAEIHEILSSLIVHRIQHDDEIKKVVFNGAISAIGNLTANQLKIISLTFMFTRVSWKSINTWEEFVRFFNNIVSKLIPFKDTPTEFGHIESVSCGKVLDISSWNILMRIRNSFSNIFLNAFQTSEIENLSIDDNIKSQIFEKVNPETYKCKFDNLLELDRFFQQKDPNIDSIVKPFYEKHFIPESEILTKIESIPLGKILIEQCRDKSMEKLLLTPMGDAIALTHLRIISNIKLDSNVWIN